MTGNSSSFSSACLVIARQRAELVGNQNLIVGSSPNLQDDDIMFPSASIDNPRVQVIAARGTYNGSDHSNPLPVFFMKIFRRANSERLSQGARKPTLPLATVAPIGEKCVKPCSSPEEEGTLRRLI